MRKLLIILTLVIVMVSLHWFRELVAQDLSGLSEADKAALLSKYRQSMPTGDAQPGRYSTPPIYDSTQLTSRPEIAPPVDSLGNLIPSTPDSGPLAFEQLKPFGTDLFSGPRASLPPDDIASDDSYILGPGDNLIINLWGRTENEYNLTVDREGKIFIPKVGEIVVWGKTLAEFKTLSRSRLQKAYTNFEMNVSLGKIRSIRIYLTGEIKAPGAYTVSSLTSLFNALYLAGGPTERGSMRNIRLMRAGKMVAEVDIYKFLLEGDNSLDVRLESGDAIFVPVASTRVAIRGEVTRPALYEMTGDETARDLLELCGGPTARAHLARVMLERIADRQEWEVIDVNLQGDSATNDLAQPLRDGDRLTVFSVFEAKQNMVAVFGQVKHPGYYERTDTTRVSDLIERAALQDYDVYYERANLFRRHSDWRTEVISLDLRSILDGTAADILLTDRDSLHVYSMQDVSWDKRVHIDGQVNEPGEFQFYDGMTISDLIFLAGSYTRSAARSRAEVARLDSLGQIELFYVDLTSGEAEQTYLRENDRVYIRQIPQWRLHRTVSLEGEVRYPGEYVLRDNHETLHDLLRRAGGFTPNAFPRGIVFERQSIGSNLERLHLRQQLENSSPLVRDSLGEIRRETFFEFETSSVNRLAIDIDRLLKSNGAEGDVVLEPGDRIFVPSTPSGISVLGAVAQNGTLNFHKDRSVRDYIKRAGDFTKRADEGSTRLVKANGEVYADGVLGQRVDMGDVIVVPTKIEEKSNFGKTLTTVLSVTTGALTTALLISKL